MGDLAKPSDRHGVDRRGFLAGGAAALAVLLGACGTDLPIADGGGDRDGEDASGRSVVIVGAGAAGMTAAHLLRQRGATVRVLEAASSAGGRVRHDRDFVDFPLPLGAEWVHVDESILDEIVNDPDVEVSTELVPYAEDDELASIDEDYNVTMLPLRDFFDGDTKFVGSSWLDFFETCILPGIADAVSYDTQVVEVQHDDSGVSVIDAVRVAHRADHVIVTVPLAVLQRRDIVFSPPLESDRLEAIDEAEIWSGFKAFFEFAEAFYPAATAFPDSDTDEGQRLFYDAAYGQDTEHHVLGIFCAGAPAERYQAMTDEVFLADVLAELDQATDGAASQNYRRHRVQDWNAEPFARGAYLADHAPSWISERLAEPLGSNVYFAGDAYTSFDDWGSVHTAVRSAASAVDALFG